MILDLQNMPSVSLHDTKQLPKNNPGLYFVTNGNKEILYIGKAQCLNKRHTNHNRMQDFKNNDCVRIFYQHYSLDELDCVETENIKHYQPSINQQNRSTPLAEFEASKSLMNRFLDLKKEMKHFSKEVEESKDEVLELLFGLSEGKFENEIGILTLGSRTTWQYSEKVKELQLEEQNNGTASTVTSSYVNSKIFF